MLNVIKEILTQPQPNIIINYFEHGHFSTSYYFSNYYHREELVRLIYDCILSLVKVKILLNEVLRLL